MTGREQAFTDENKAYGRNSRWRAANPRFVVDGDIEEVVGNGFKGVN